MERKSLDYNVFAFDVLYAEVVIIFSNNTFDWVWFCLKNQMSHAQLNNPRDDVMDWRWILKSISFQKRPSLSKIVMFPEVFIALFKK